MILIADSGSTKTHWRLVRSGVDDIDFTSLGLNPFFADSKNFREVLHHSFSNVLDPEQVSKLFFYGSGCASIDMAKEVKSRLEIFFPRAEVNVYSDILGAARSLFAKNKGLVVILGTGMSTGFFNGETVERKTPSLGYVLGDEGSGAYLGKKLLRHWQYGELPKDLSDELNVKYPLSQSELLNRLYNEQFPNRFLAEFVPFLAEHSSHFYVKTMVEKSFCKLVERHLAKYSCFTEIPVGVVGSVGMVFSDILRSAIESRGGRLAQMLHFPIDGLTFFHTKMGTIFDH